MFQVAIEGPQPTPVRAGASRAGVCAFTYHAHAAGTYTVSATVQGAHVRNSPAVVVASIAEACSSQCEVKGSPLTLSTVKTVCIQFLIIVIGLCIKLLMHTTADYQLGSLNIAGQGPICFCKAASSRHFQGRVPSTYGMHTSFIVADMAHTCYTTSWQDESKHSKVRSCTELFLPVVRYPVLA